MTKIKSKEENIEEAFERVKKLEEDESEEDESEEDESDDKASSEANSGSEMEKMASTLRDIREDIKFWKEM